MAIISIDSLVPQQPPFVFDMFLLLLVLVLGFACFPFLLGHERVLINYGGYHGKHTKFDKRKARDA